MITYHWRKRFTSLQTTKITLHEKQKSLIESSNSHIIEEMANILDEYEQLLNDELRFKARGSL